MSKMYTFSSYLYSISLFIRFSLCLHVTFFQPSIHLSIQNSCLTQHALSLGWYPQAYTFGTFNMYLLLKKSAWNIPLNYTKVSSSKNLTNETYTISIMKNYIWVSSGVTFLSFSLEGKGSGGIPGTLPKTEVFIY